MTKSLQGINLGGWLVLERWITPSLFADTVANDEWSLGQELGEPTMSARLRHHRDTFITKEDISWISAYGFTVVRLPIGYWALKDTDGFYNVTEYIDRLFGWAKEYDLQVILDLHGAPGSQNGWDHSGKAGLLSWHTKKMYISETLAVLEGLAQQYGQNPALYGIEVLNEPRWDVPIDTLLGFYSQAYATLRELCRSEVKIIVSDSFRPKEMVFGLQAIGLADIVIDTHLYQVFSDADTLLSFEGHRQKVNSWRAEVRKVARYFPVMVGEWSAALDQSTFVDRSQNEISNMINEYFANQQEIFNTEALIWCYWTYKTEYNSPWSYSSQSFFLIK